MKYLYTVKQYRICSFYNPIDKCNFDQRMIPVFQKNILDSCESVYFITLLLLHDFLHNFYYLVVTPPSPSPSGESGDYIFVL